jgi:hypothetical protein
MTRDLHPDVGRREGGERLLVPSRRAWLAAFEDEALCSPKRRRPTYDAQRTSDGGNSTSSGRRFQTAGSD